MGKMHFWPLLILIAVTLSLARRAGAEGTTARQPGSELQIPKVALMFLTRGPMPHESTWTAWFAAAKWLVPLHSVNSSTCTAGYTASATSHLRHAESKSGGQHYEEQALFSVYLHPSVNFTEYGEGSLFRGREVPQRVQVTWGDHSMVVAMRILLRAAVQQALNRRFVFLCEMSIPLYPPTVMWQQLMADRGSRLSACPMPSSEKQDPKWSMWRWTPLMLPYITADMFLKTSQWVGLNREHAELIDQDMQVLDLFAKFCRHPFCVGDEHYFATLLAYHGVGQNTTCAGNAVSCTWNQDYHPVTFEKEQISTELLLSLRHNSPGWKEETPCADHTALKSAPQYFVRADSAWRFGCETDSPPPYNSSLLDGATCTLFARKFHPKAASQVLEIITGCDQRLGIAPKATCRNRRVIRKARLSTQLKEVSQQQ